MQKTNNSIYFFLIFFVSTISWNFLTKTDDPFPVSLNHNAAPHGTVVAGIIAAAQNGKGIMGIAPQVRVGAANLLEGQQESNAFFLAYGNAPWSSKAHVFNASYGGDTSARPYDSETDADTSAVRGLKNLRDGKGAVFLKAAGNSFSERLCGIEVAYYDCTIPANDPMTLESNIITVAALNAKGSASTYSSAGSVVWITGMGGEYGNYGTHGEAAGPQSNDGPHHHPALSRGGDVKIPDFTPVAYWYNGEVEPPDDLDNIPAREAPFAYQRVTSIGKLSSGEQTVDQFQVLLSGENVCLGSLGIAVKSPAGTVSLLKVPNDHFKADGWDTFEDYALGSFAFYGEPAQGDWEIFAVASNPAVSIEVGRYIDDQWVLSESEPCPAEDSATPLDFRFITEARIIAQ